ncbi:MlaC/ttg2D family ABC transporter substrate-binding protein [Simiduia agarivorans]|uniref:Toluene-tolerance protein n=1 Tax=Simiduia agarivorans (strain DSM 21679 / JCM 13881 / BCRC 17597 / SA1) TaxID=1117647 RepID=K4KQX2_SIMAS|nr:ABC transporter substrate-binding protein [Simiduia agarivorans]AFV00646.1 toluene-tolerance protein [Simiduia agarivorans SA1 = DSM 21679]
MRNLIGTLLLVIGFVVSSVPVLADPVGPREVVVQVIDSLKSSVREHDANSDPKGDKLQRQLQQILEPVVDFGFIARVVMGDAANSASPAQMKRFEDTFRSGMVATYAKGVSGYLDAEMNVLPLSPEAEGQNRVAVRQEVITASGIQIVDYTMAKNRRTGEWKLINVVLNGINLGKTFRSQFAQSYKQYGGDLDKVIDHWGQAPQTGA